LHKITKPNALDSPVNSNLFCSFRHFRPLRRDIVPPFGIPGVFVSGSERPEAKTANKTLDPGEAK
jgi:hypothetical protein